MPFDKNYKRVILSFAEFHKYFIANPDSYEWKESYVHPFRENYYIQFPTLKEYSKYEDWLFRKSNVEISENNQRDFIRIAQEDLDNVKKREA